MRINSTIKMKYLYFIFLSVLLSGNCSAQSSVAWLKGKNWQLYNAGENDITKENFDSLKNLKSVYLSEDTLIHYLKDATVIPTEKTKGAVWMGAYWVSYKTDTHLYLLKISYYGGFFVDENTGIYYELPVWERQNWLTYFSNAAIQLQSGNP
jgi:hypothetical protein